MLILILVAAVSLVVGAYSHKWLASVTGAPAKLTTSNAAAAVSSLVAHGTDAAHTAIDTAAADAKATIAK